MNEDLDPTLQEWFDAGPPAELRTDAFTAQVMTSTRFARGRQVAGALAALGLVAVCAVALLAPLQELVALVAQALSSALVDLGDDWWALALSPVNSVATVLVLVWKLARVGITRIRGTSYA